MRATEGWEELVQTTQKLLEALACAQAAEWARQGQLRHAEAFLRPLAQRPDASPQILDLMAKVLAQQGLWEEARQFWERALALQPTNKAFQRAIQRCNRSSHAPNYEGLLKVGLGILLVALISGIVTLSVSIVHLQRQVTLLQNRVQPQRRATIIPKPLPERPPAASVPDWRVPVAQALQADLTLRLLKVTVTQEGVVLRLQGEVPNLWTRYRIERLARKVAEQATVDVSELRLPMRYIVRRGDSLWHIAQRIYGNPLEWSSIARANDLLPPYRLQVGQVLQLPE